MKEGLIIAIVCSLALAQDTSLDTDDGRALVRCPRPVCDVFCEKHVKDERGCDTCECEEPEDECGGCDEGFHCKGYVGPRDIGPVSGCLANHCLLYKCRDPDCEFGIKLTEEGCPTCGCAESLCQNKRCRSNEECLEIDGKAICQAMPKIPCAVPMCASPCDYGFRQNENGCDTCDCKELPCEGIKCGEGQTCENNLECTMGMNCRMFMCTDKTEAVCEDLDCEACDLGHVTDENGCPTCECQRDLCPDKSCTDDEICIMDKHVGCSHDKCPTEPICEPKSLCHHHRRLYYQQAGLRQEPADLPGMPTGHLGYLPECNPDTGKFHPQQCHQDRRECWCVDDRGLEVDGTRHSLDASNVPTCEEKKTSAVEILYQMTYEIEETEIDITDLHGIVKEHISHWMAVKTEQITYIKVEADTVEVQTYTVQVVVIADEVTDLPSAAFNMHRHMHKGHCDIPYNGKTFHPKPETVKVQHQYGEPQLPEHGLKEEPQPSFAGFCHAHKTSVLIGCVGGSLILIAVATLICYSASKKRRAALFRHRRLTNHYDQNLQVADQCMQSEKKQPLGGPVVFIDGPTGDKSSTA